MTAVVLKRIDEQAGVGRLGRHVEFDERSRLHRLAGAPLPLKTVTWRRYGSAFDQGNLGSCTGNAIAGVLNTQGFHKTGAKLLTENDAVQLYELATVIDGFPGSYPPDDTGSSGLAACKAAKERGLISSYQHAFGIDEALQALMRGPVITGVNWYSSMDAPDGRGRVTVGGFVRGGHEFEVNGYNASNGYVRCWNSWGSSYGDHGRFYIHRDAWAQLLDEQGDVTIPVA